jgi:hypothetical protein
MKLSDFILLNEEEKTLAVLHQGVLIGKRKNTALVTFLFQVENFYVEARFNATNRNVKEFRIFDNGTLLQPYLDDIRLDDLLN